MGSFVLQLYYFQIKRCGGCSSMGRLVFLCHFHLRLFMHFVFVFVVLSEKKICGGCSPMGLFLFVIVYDGVNCVLYLFC